MSARIEFIKREVNGDRRLGLIDVTVLGSVVIFSSAVTCVKVILTWDSICIRTHGQGFLLHQNGE